MNIRKNIIEAEIIESVIRCMLNLQKMSISRNPAANRYPMKGPLYSTFFRPLARDIKITKQTMARQMMFIVERICSADVSIGIEWVSYISLNSGCLGNGKPIKARNRKNMNCISLIRFTGTCVFLHPYILASYSAAPV